MKTNALLTDLTPAQEEKVSGGFGFSLKDAAKGYGQLLRIAYVDAPVIAYKEVSKTFPSVGRFFSRLFRR